MSARDHGHESSSYPAKRTHEVPFVPKGSDEKVREACTCLSPYLVFSDDITGASGMSSLVAGVPRITIGLHLLHSSITEQFPFITVNLQSREVGARNARLEFTRALRVVNISDFGLRVDSALRGHVGTYLQVLLKIRGVLLTDTIPEYNRYTLHGITVHTTGKKKIRETVGLKGNLSEERNELIIADSQSYNDLERLASICIERQVIPADPGPLIALVARKRLGPGVTGSKPRSLARKQVKTVACVVGTRTQVTQKQLELIRGRGGVLQKPEGGRPREVDVFWFDFMRERGQISEAFMNRLDQYDALVLSGGETANYLLTRAGFGYILNGDSIQPLVSSGVIVGGRWDGKSIVLKGGIVGDEDVFTRIFKWLKGN